MNDDLKRVNLRDIVDRISENTIVLPDFQRGFTWKENNRQKALLASVLTKLPIGTVLFLNVKTEDYGYKKIGKNERNIDNLEGKQEVKALLDGHPKGDMRLVPGAVTNTAEKNYMTQHTQTAAPVQYHAT